MAKEKLKIVLCTMDEPYYMPKYIHDTLMKLGLEIEVLSVYALPHNIANKTFFQMARYYLSYFGIILFLYMSLLRVYYLLCNLVMKGTKSINNFHSVKLVCKKFGIKFSTINTLNSEEVLNELKTLGPDVIFSIACPQIFGNKLISIPSKGCLNIHSSLLPKYRGLNANFWVLAKGEKTTGVTIHYIQQGIDDGDIILQKQIPIKEYWSVHDLYLKVIDVGSGMIAESLKNIYEDKVVTQANDVSKGTYFSFVTSKDIKEFRSRKKRFFKYY